MNIIFRLGLIALLAVAAPIQGCGEDKPDTIGEHIDKGIEDIGEGIEKMGDDIKDATN